MFATLNQCYEVIAVFNTYSMGKIIWSSNSFINLK